MKDKGFFSRGPGLVEPWRAKDVRLDLEARRVDAGIECRADEVRAGQDGRRLHIHGRERRQWRHPGHHAAGDDQSGAGYRGRGGSRSR